MERILPRCAAGLAALVLGCLALTVATDARAEAYWFEKYQSVVRLVDRGHHDEALDLLRTVIAERPAPVAPFRIPGNRYIDYLPYLQRARIQLAQGNLRGAGHSLDVSETFGAVMRNDRTWGKFLALRQQLNAAVGHHGNARDTPAPVMVGTLSR